MQKSIILIEIDDLYIKFAHQTYSKKSKQINNFEKLNADGMIKDGQIEDKQRINQALKKYLSDNKIKSKQICMILKSQKIILKYADFYDINEKEIGDIIKNNIEDYFPIDVSNYIIDYKKLSENRVLIVAIPEEIIWSYIAFFKELGLNLITVDIFENCISKAFKEDTDNILVISKNINGLSLIYISEGFLYNSKDIKSLEYKDIHTKLNKLSNFYKLNAKINKVYMLSDNIEALSDYFKIINVEYEICDKSEADMISIVNLY